MRRLFWMRRTLAIAFGIAATLAIFAAVDALNQWLYPRIGNFDALDRAGVAAQVAALPLPAKLLGLFAWFGGAFGGAWLAWRIGDRVWLGWVVVMLVLAMAVLNLITVPQPIWLSVATLIAPIAGGWLARRVHHKPYKGEPLLG